MSERISAHALPSSTIFFDPKIAACQQVPTKSLRTQDSENQYERGVQKLFDPVLVAQSGVSATKCDPLAKI